MGPGGARLGLAVILVPLAATLAPGSTAQAEEFVVGTARYPTLTSVPWSSLGSDDVVTIPWRAEPYRETFAITTSGALDHPIVVRGTAGPGGERPVIDGQGAVAGVGTHSRALISIRSGARHVVIEGLELTNAHPDHAHDGLFTSAASSAIYVEDGAHVVVRDCDLHGNGNGFFSAPGTADLLVQGNHIWGNGNAGSTQEHNSYTESDGIVFEWNRFGPLCDGCRGNNLKDRSAGTIVRYNLIEGGNRALDLVEAETDDADFTSRVASTPVHVYGNVLRKIDDTAQSQVVHFGGDGGNPSSYRRRLHFYNNTVYSTRATRTTFFHFDADAPEIDIRNSVFVTTSNQNLLLDSSTSTGASVRLGSSFLPTGWSISVEPALAGTVTSSAVQTGADPGFVDAAGGDFHLTADAAVRDRGAALVRGVPGVLRQYVAHLTTEARPADGPLDLGAFEVCETGCAPATDPDAGVPGDGGPGDGGPGADGDSSGCGCRTASPTSPLGAIALAVLALAATARPRRRRG